MSETTNVRYPRTFHLPWSPGATSDDKLMMDVSALDGDLVMTEKMDGGNFTMTADRCWARSPEAVAQPWDDHARAVWAAVRRDIPAGWRVCGESMAARRSVPYDNLPGPFLVFGIFDESGTLLAWDAVKEWSWLLGLPTVPVIGRPIDVFHSTPLWVQSGRSIETSEGYVVRRAGRIGLDEFGAAVGKWVRPNHVRTSADWRRRDDYALNGISS